VVDYLAQLFLGVASMAVGMTKEHEIVSLGRPGRERPALSFSLKSPISNN
jgi:hypothetical protein